MESADGEVSLHLPVVGISGLDVERVAFIVSWLQLFLEVSAVLVLCQDRKPHALFLVLFQYCLVGIILHRHFNLNVFAHSKHQEWQLDRFLIIGRQCEIILSKKYFCTFNEEVHVVGKGYAFSSHTEVYYGLSWNIVDGRSLHVGGNIFTTGCGRTNLQVVITSNLDHPRELSVCVRLPVGGVAYDACIDLLRWVTGSEGVAEVLLDAHLVCAALFVVFLLFLLVFLRLFV